MTSPVPQLRSNRRAGDVATDAALVTPSDTVNGFGVNMTAWAILVTGTGDLDLVTPSGTVIPFRGVAANVIIPIQAERINATNTTATCYALF